MFDPIQDFILDYDDLKRFLLESNQLKLPIQNQGIKPE